MQRQLKQKNESSLLSDPRSSNDHELNNGLQQPLIVEDEEETMEEKDKKNKSLFLVFTRSAMETSLGSFFEFGLATLFMLYFITKHTDQETTNAYGLGFMWSCCFGISIYLGLGSGLETMVSHAYGAQEYRTVGILLQKNIVVMLIFYIPILILMYNAQHILMIFNDNQQLCERAAYFCRLFSPTILLWGTYYTLWGYLNGHCIYKLQVYTSAICTFFMFGLGYFFISYLNWGLEGAAISFFIFRLCMVLVLCIFIRSSNALKQTLQQPSMEAFKDLGVYLKIALPVGSLMTLQWLVGEIFIFLAASLTSNQFSAQILLGNFSNLFYQFPEGISIVTATYVGNQMGEGNAKMAQKYTLFGVILFLSIEFFFLIFFFVFRHQWADQFSVSPEVADIVLQIFPFYLVQIFAHGAQTIISGVMRGITKEGFASITYFTIIVFGGVGSAYYLCFVVGLGIKGLIFGNSGGYILYSSANIIGAAVSSWEKLAENLQLRFNSQDKIDFSLEQTEESNDTILQYNTVNNMSQLS